MTDTIPELLRDWLTQAVRVGASDLHLIPGHAPVIRLHGDLTELPGPAISEEVAGPLLLSLCSPAIIERLGKHKDADFAFPSMAGRNAFVQTCFTRAGTSRGACESSPTRSPSSAGRTSPSTSPSGLHSSATGSSSSSERQAPAKAHLSP